MERLGKIVANFKNSYSERTAKGANLCEKACEEYLKSRENICYQKFGFDEAYNKIPSKWFFQIPKVIRNCPDFIVIGENVSFIECKGCISDLRVKVDDLGSYEFWNDICRLYFFIYRVDGEIREKKIISYTDLMLRIQCKDKVELDYYPDNGKEYYKIPFLAL